MGLVKMNEYDDPARTKEMRDFTVIALLKFEYYFFLMFNYSSIIDYVNFPNFNVVHNIPFNTKVF